jgi:predicted dehydrogenase
MSKIKVGFIGLNPDSHWASTAHIPALESLSDDFEVTGVANSTFESAQRTAKALHLKHAFATPQELVSSDEIDLVVVTVKVRTLREQGISFRKIAEQLRCSLSSVQRVIYGEKQQSTLNAEA